MRLAGGARPGDAHDTVRHGSVLPRFAALDWLLVTGLVVIAVAVRLVFFTGFFGSDEVTYVQAAKGVVDGAWTDTTYIGALRLGMNYPIAAAIMAFGTSELAAALWGLAASVAEIGAVYWFARRAFGRELAMIAGFLMTLLPLHVHLAGRILADSPLALCITLTFVLLYEAEERGNRKLYVLAGVAAGLAFWIKEATSLFVLVPFLWACVRRRDFIGCTMFALAIAAVIAANFAAMWLLSGNALQLLDSMEASLKRYADIAQSGTADDRSGIYYLRYLFAYPWHTWIVGHLAAAGAVVAVYRISRRSPDALPLAFLLSWALGLIAVFSLFVVSVNPFNLIPKQANYMSIFLAPLCVLAGVALVALKSVLAKRLVLVAYTVGAIVLCGLEQETIRGFTANSRGTLAFAAAHPESTIHVVTNAERLNHWVAMTSGTGLAPVQNLRSMTALFPTGDERPAPDGNAGEVLAIVDRQTLDWGKNGLRSDSRIPACWAKIARIDPLPDRSAGHVLVALLVRLGRAVPVKAAAGLTDRFEARLTPLPADVYRVANCG